MPRKLSKFLILFDNPNLLYFPGQFLSGRVLLELQDEIPVLGLHFHVVGEGVVQTKSVRQERTYDKENYIDFRMRLLGDNTEQSGPSVLSPGIHSFPFKLGLPLGLPSTFLGRYGWIQYYCKCALREPSGLIHKNHQVFIVMNPIDLNLEEPSLAEPFRCDIEPKMSSLSCFNTGTVKCKIQLDRGGFVSGESISVSSYVRNFSNTTIRATKVALTETVQYLSRGKVVQVEKRELAVVNRGKIRPNGKDEWTNELYIPPLPPTNLRGCNIIKISYDVFFTIEPKSIEKPIKLQLPIVIATYPFRNTHNDVSNTWPDSVLKPDTHYPSTLPIFRPWLQSDNN